MDKAHKDTDKAIAALEKKVVEVYTEAQADVQKKLDDFTRKHKAKDKIKRQQVENGEITEEEYQSWLRGQVFQGKQWQAKLDSITDTLVHADIVAQKIINDEVNGVYANNANWEAYQLEHGSGMDYGFDIYNAEAVNRLLRDNPDLLPKPRVDIPKDEQWNRESIRRAVAQGIIQGESLDKIAKRIADVTDHDKNLSLTRARTAMTGAQNAGRQDTFSRAAARGIQLEKEWLATLDMHTRTEHAKLDGQHQPVDKPFVIDQYEIRYPGDPHAAPAMVYNCRCTMKGRLLNHPRQGQRYDNIDGIPIPSMSYAEWYKAKTGEDLP